MVSFVERVQQFGAFVREEFMPKPSEFLIPRPLPEYPGRTITYESHVNVTEITEAKADKSRRQYRRCPRVR